VHRRGGLVLGLGGPVGPPPLIPQAIRELGERERQRSFAPVLVPLDTEHETVYREAGFHFLPIGREAKLPLDDFTLEGGPRKSLREGINRARREGLRFELWSPPLEDGQLRDLQEVSRSWLEERRLPERSFGAGVWDGARLSRSRVAVVRSRFGRLEAFADLVEGYSLHEASVDLLRRRPTAPPGAMERLLTGIVQTLRDEGTSVFNLGLAPLAGVGTSPNASWMERGLSFLYRSSSPFYDFRGLHAFKEKFRPCWEPRYLAWCSRRSLPKALIALAEVSPRSTPSTASARSL